MFNNCFHENRALLCDDVEKKYGRARQVTDYSVIRRWNDAICMLYS